MIDAPAERPPIDLHALPLTEWRCAGRRADGRPCNQVLTEFATDSAVRLRKRCDKCGAWNTTERYTSSR